MMDRIAPESVLTANRLVIRKGGASDAEALRKLGCESYRDHFSHLWSPEGMQRFLDSDFSTEVLRSTLNAPARHLWLIASDSDDKMLGYAKLNWSVPDPVFGVVGAELQKIYVLGSEAGKGVGAALLTHVFSCVEQRSPGSRIWLDVLKSNVGAQKFYARMGFKTAGELPFETDLAEIGMAVMIRDFV